MLCVGLDPKSGELVERGEPVGERTWFVYRRCAVEVDHRSFAA